MPDYKNGKIYTIRCLSDKDLIYVGSTCQLLSYRWSDHKRNSTKEKYENICLYVQINQKGIDDFYIELYEKFPCTCKEELLKREGEVIRSMGSMNHIISGRTKTEYYVENKDHINLLHRNYYEKHSEDIKKNKKQYYHENKETIQIRQKEKMQCECGCMIARSDIAKHKKTKKHIDLMIVISQ